MKSGMSSEKRFRLRSDRVRSSSYSIDRVHVGTYALRGLVNKALRRRIGSTDVGIFLEQCRFLNKMFFYSLIARAYETSNVFLFLFFLIYENKSSSS